MYDNFLVVIISAMLISLSAICNSIMDTISHHFMGSIFNNSIRFKRKWWDPSISWRNKYIDGDPTKGRNMKFIAFTDAWHFFKSLMIILIILTIVIFGYYEGMTFFDIMFLYPLFGFVWNITFNIFYNKILMKHG